MHSFAARLALLAALALATSACTSVFDETAEQGVDVEFDGGEIDASLTRDDLDCSAENLGADDQTDILVGHYVVDGRLGEVCYGEADGRVLQAFEELAIITPPLQLRDLGLFAGFEWTGSEDETTLAYVSAADDDGAYFTMAVGVDAIENDLDEARLTNAHEFAHVITQTEPELDRSIFSEDCDTYWNGDGCFADDSLMWTWIQEFWDADAIASFDGDSEPSVSDGDERCDLDDSYFGPYAASNPEEDFAEAFSAFVYGLDAATPGQQTKLDWLADQPGLAEFSERALDAGVAPLDNTFEVCG